MDEATAPAAVIEASDPAGSAVDAGLFRSVMGRFATGVVVITGMDEHGPQGLTCQSFVSLSLDPPLIAFAPALSSRSWPRVAKSGRFTVNILSRDQADVARRFASKSDDKFSGIDWSLDDHGAPLLEGVHGWVHCAIEQVSIAGDHELVIARVLGLGSPESEDSSPLLYHRAAFGGLR